MVEDHLRFPALMGHDQMRRAVTGPDFATGPYLEEGLAEVVLEVC